MQHFPVFFANFYQNGDLRALWRDAASGVTTLRVAASEVGFVATTAETEGD